MATNIEIFILRCLPWSYHEGMNEWKGLAIGILLMGGMLVLIGLMLLTVGKLPGDILVKKGNFTFFFPIVTSIVLSLILTVALNIYSRR